MKGCTKEEKGQLKQERVGIENITNQGYIAKCILYTNAHNIFVEFQDEYKAKVHTSWQMFRDRKVLNPYHPNIYGGIIGNKYPSTIGKKTIKEYFTWYNMLKRCFDQTEKERDKSISYKDITCCEKWLLYEKFYEWLHSQENFDKWLNGNFTLDKDILIKGNKIYSPKTCCLVPENVNKLFIKRGRARGKYPIGVVYHKASNSFVAQAHDGTGKQIHLGCYDSPEHAFYVYKIYKEKLIKRVAQEEYDKGNIIKRCYEAMLNYQVEITD